MPALSSSIIEPLWDQFQVLIPTVEDHHPLGCHRPRVPDRLVFDKLIQVLVFGCAYWQIADATCSATTLRRRRDAWLAAGIMDRLATIALDAYDTMIGLDLTELAVDGCVTQAPCGGEEAGRSPVDRGKQGRKRSTLVDGAGIPLGSVIAPAARPETHPCPPPAQGGPGRGRSGLVRCRDRRGAGGPSDHSEPGAPELCRAGAEHRTGPGRTGSTRDAWTGRLRRI